MKILALYDIHGNIDALDAVLADPRVADRYGILVGGDAVPGPFAREVLRRLDELEEPVFWVRGNGEREVAEARHLDSAPSDDDLMLKTAWLSARALGPDLARAVGDLPTTLELDWVRYCHATPRSDVEMLTRVSPLARYEEAFGGMSERLIVGGHTHQQHEVTLSSGARFVNAGSVGLPYEGAGAARWLLVTDGTPELGATPYDAEAAGRRMLDAGWPDERSITAALIDPVAPDEVTQLFESMATSSTT